MNNINYQRLLELKSLIENSQASDKQKREYIELLCRNNNITRKQYDDYLLNRNTEEIIKATLTIGGVILAAWLLSKLFGD